MSMDAIILAGGKGSRLSPFHAPKTLLPIAGVPILYRLIEHLGAGQNRVVDRVVVCTGYRAMDISAAIKWIPDGRQVGVFTSNAGEDVAMGARLLHAREEHRLKGRVLVLYGDELADVDVRGLVDAHERRQTDITFAAYRERLPFGVVADGRVHDDESVLVNIGFAVVEPRAWEVLRLEDGLADWINKVDSSAYLHIGRRATVNSLAELQHAEKVWG